MRRFFLSMLLMNVVVHSNLRTDRARLLEMFTDVTCNPDMMKNATDAYFSLLQGRGGAH